MTGHEKGKNCAVIFTNGEDMHFKEGEWEMSEDGKAVFVDGVYEGKLYRGIFYVGNLAGFLYDV